MVIIFVTTDGIADGTIKMDPLDTLDDRQLQGFFRRSKTEMSCMDKPQSFLKQLRDHELILEEKFQVRLKVSRIKES